MRPHPLSAAPPSLQKRRGELIGRGYRVGWLGSCYWLLVIELACHAYRSGRLQAGYWFVFGVRYSVTLITGYCVLNIDYCLFEFEP